MDLLRTYGSDRLVSFQGFDICTYPRWMRQSQVILENLDFDLSWGESIAICSDHREILKGIVHAIFGFRHRWCFRGAIYYRGLNLLSSKKFRTKALGGKIQWVPGDADQSLNPFMSIGETIGEPLKRYSHVRGHEVQVRAQGLMMNVGLNPLDIYRYPYELDHMQRAQVNLARALATDPEWLILEEPLRTLRPLEQGFWIELLREVQMHFELTYLILSRDLEALRMLSDRIVFVRYGKMKGDFQSDRWEEIEIFLDSLVSSK